ncbi:MAG: hypothetical protein NC817_00295, partial [Candidatus Omnitrophica bacterium]|nr:hypothetical protein [Candidatus Omnitrophota bacterium]
MSKPKILIVDDDYYILELLEDALRDDFNEKSDIDFLIEFNNSEDISLYDIIDIQEYFKNLTKR